MLALSGIHCKSNSAELAPPACSGHQTPGGAGSRAGQPGQAAMSASFQDWEERDIYVAKRRTELDAQSVAHSTWSTTSSKRLPMHRDSTQISDLLNPVRGIRDAQMRRALLATSSHPGCSLHGGGLNGRNVQGGHQACGPRQAQPQCAAASEPGQQGAQTGGGGGRCRSRGPCTAEEDRAAAVAQHQARPWQGQALESFAAGPCLPSEGATCHG